MKVLNSTESSFQTKKIAIRYLTPQSANDLNSAGFPFGDRELFPSISDVLMRTTKLAPYTSRLVAYHTEDKRAVGFVCLVEDTLKIFSIKFVFTDPRYRNMGIGSQMLNHALLVAKSKGAKKVYLDVKSSDTHIISLYKKFGFKVLGTKLVGQGSISEKAHLQVITQTILGKGYLAKYTYKNASLIPLCPHFNSNKQLFFHIYKRYVNKRVMDFFELDVNNSLNGYTQMFRPPIIRDVLVDATANSAVLIFNYPLFSNATVEIGCISEKMVPSIMTELLKILQKRGMAYVRITIFNLDDFQWSDWFKENEFDSFKFLIMGRTV